MFFSEDYKSVLKYVFTIIKYILRYHRVIIFTKTSEHIFEMLAVLINVLSKHHKKA